MDIRKLAVEGMLEGSFLHDEGTVRTGPVIHQVPRLSEKGSAHSQHTIEVTNFTRSSISPAEFRRRSKAARKARAEKKLATVKMGPENGL